MNDRERERWLQREAERKVTVEIPSEPLPAQRPTDTAIRAHAKLVAKRTRQRRNRRAARRGR